METTLSQPGNHPTDILVLIHFEVLEGGRERAVSMTGNTLVKKKGKN